MKIVRIILGCAVCGVLWAGNVSSAPPDPMEHSVSELSQGLEHLVESSDNLAAANEQLSISAKALRQNEAALQEQSRFFDKNNARLEQELTGYQDKTKDKVELTKQNQAKAKEHKALLVKLDQEIALKKIALAEREKQQTYVLKLLEITKKGGTVEQNIQAIKDTQIQMSRQVNEGRERINALENEWKELSFWYGSPSVSVPQLTATRNELREKLASLQKSGIYEKWEQDQRQIQKLEDGIKILVKHHNNYLEELQTIESKYDNDKNQPQFWTNEKKLQQNLNQLKRDNKGLQRQAADLRRDMVEWDKKKSALEGIVSRDK